MEKQKAIVTIYHTFGNPKENKSTVERQHKTGMVKISLKTHNSGNKNKPGNVLFQHGSRWITY